jgi:rRNA maturation endonuclease Nob1
VNPIAILFGFGLLAFSVFYVASPLRSNANTKQPIGTGKKILTEQQRTNARQAVLLALRDLDFDFQAGKVAEVDYQPLRADLLAQAAALIEDQERVKDDAIEALIQSRRVVKNVQQSLLEDQCRQCQAPLLKGAKFCSKCGAAVKEAQCLNCKNSIQPSDRFCPSCGGAINVENPSH